MLKIKRAYDEPEDEDGYRMLVDRLWPRGLSIESAQVDAWFKEIAPSNDLRKWFGHDPEKWDEFKRRYFEELNGKTELIEKIRKKSRETPITMLYAGDKNYNNAAALKEYIETRW